MSLTQFAPSLGTFWKLIEANGHDPERLFKKLHIDPQVLSDPNARISYSKTEGIWDWISREIKDPCVGLKAAKYWHPSAAGALGYAWLASSSLRSAVGRLVRYAKVMSEAVLVETEEQDGAFSLIFSFHKGARSIPVQIDGILAQVTQLCRLNYGKDLQLLKVSVTHPPPTCSGDFFEYFRCPVTFDAPDNRLTLPAEILDRQLPSSNTQLAKLNDQIMIEYLAKLDKNNITERVKSVLIRQFPSGNVSEHLVADALYMNLRTMQRRLSEKGTSFKSILNQMRQELAMKYIQDSSMTLSEISFLLGFAEISSFSRAFKRWTGESPRAFRRTS